MVNHSTNSSILHLTMYGFFSNKWNITNSQRIHILFLLIDVNTVRNHIMILIYCLVCKNKCYLLFKCYSLSAFKYRISVCLQELLSGKQLKNRRRKVMMILIFYPKNFMTVFWWNSVESYNRSTFHVSIILWVSILWISRKPTNCDFLHKNIIWLLWNIYFSMRITFLLFFCLLIKYGKLKIQSRIQPY